MQTKRRSFLMAAGVSAMANSISALQAEPIRIAIVGTGFRGRAHLGILKTLPQFQVVALADTTPENLDLGATLAPGAKTYSDYRNLLEQEQRLDAVVVVTPNFLHADVTVAALDRGLPVLCEKPMATKIEDANRMIEASKRSGKPLYIGFQKRLAPAVLKMQELVASGEIGTIELVSANLFRGDWNPRSWKYTDPKTGVATNWRFLTHTEGSALLEDGIHELDVLNWVINDRVARVFASGGNAVLKQRETLDHASVIIEYEKGTKLSFDFCLFAPNSGPDGRRVVLIGSEGVLQLTSNRVAIRSRTGGAVRHVNVTDQTPKDATANPVGSAQDSETYQQFIAFAQTVRSGTAPKVGAEEAKTAIKISLLAEKAVRERRIVTWNDLPA